jgi:adenosylcobyric acid synthase
MNPVLLKSGGQRESDGAFLCNVIVMGKHFAREDYGALGMRTDEMRSMVLKAHSSLARSTNAEWVVVEGAGSCTELNLIERDIVNLPLVRKLECPWFLVADIDKGGVFAQIVGTKACVTAHDWELCCGVIVNRLRGEVKYFEPGPSMIEKLVDKPVFVVPWIYDLHLPEEDGVGIETRLRQEHQLLHRRVTGNKSIVVVVAYPHIAIDSDLVPLEQDTNVVLEWRRTVLPLPYPKTNTIILPGSRLTRSDLHWLTEETGWSKLILEHVDRGGAVFGLCGGYQMLGTHVRDEEGVEGAPGTSKGLGLLPVDSTISSSDEKVVTPRTALLDQSEQVHGFELHCGQTIRAPGTEPLLQILDTNEAEGSRVGKVSGCYLHGILKSKRARHLLLHLPEAKIEQEPSCTPDPLDRLADHLETCGLTVETILGMAKPVVSCCQDQRNSK